jgi:Tfp pilus assembly protein PilF
LAGFIEGKASQKPSIQTSYFEALSMSLNAQWAPLRGFYSGNFTYVSLPIPELYDLSKDPKQTTNLCKDPKLCAEWSKKFASFSGPFLRDVKSSRVDSETVEQLRALGYVSGGIAPTKKNYGPEDDPKGLIGIHNRVDAAMGFYNRGNQVMALEIFEKIIKERPDYSVAYLHASFIQNELGNPEQAVQTLRKAVSGGVLGVDITGSLGLYLFEAKEYPEAIQQLQVALKEDPRDIDTYNHLGMTYTAVGNFQEANSVFQKALALDPSDPSTLNNLGTLYLSQKKLELAQKFEAALSRSPHLANAYNGLGVVYASRKQWDKAIQNWELALQNNQRNYDAMLNLAYAYLESSNRQKALSLFQNFEKNAPAARYNSDLVKVRSLIQKLQ